MHDGRASHRAGPLPMTGSPAVAVSPSARLSVHDAVPEHACGKNNRPTVFLPIRALRSPRPALRLVCPAETRHRTGTAVTLRLRPTTRLSPYSRAGERLFYQRVCVAGDYPPAPLLASSAPGTIYIATGPDEQIVWLMATVLPRDASDAVNWLRGPSEKPLVLTDDRSLSEMDHKIPAD